MSSIGQAAVKFAERMDNTARKWKRRMAGPASAPITVHKRPNDKRKWLL